MTNYILKMNNYILKINNYILKISHYNYLKILECVIIKIYIILNISMGSSKYIINV